MKTWSMAAALGLLATCLLSPVYASAQSAPQPLKRIDPARFFTGTWLEIGRRPMWLTDGCVAGTTSYSRTSDPNTINVKDACREGRREGPEKSVAGPGTILDPGINARLRVRYNLLITREYWILDRAADYSWFIEASPDFQDLYIFTRKVPSASQLKFLVRRAGELGYDVRKLEFPAQPPR
jgi:apolipoprotein D and lipocalin family protein